MATSAYHIDCWRLDALTMDIDPVTGWLTMDGTAALVGVMDYDTHAEFVPAETLQDVESLLSAPLTLQHPPKNLDLETTRKYQIGTVLSARFDDDKLRVRIRVTDAEAVAAIQSGTHELSPGYQAEIDRVSGVWSGKKYDAIQRKRRYNHLALVDRARGGRQARLDSWRADGALIQRTDSMETVTIDGVEYQVPPEVAAIVTAWQASQQAPVEDDATGVAPPSPAPAGTPAAAAAPAVKTPSSITVKMDAESIANEVTNRLLTAFRQDRDLERKNAAELGEVVARVRPLLPQSYRVDGKDAGTLIADAIVAKQPELAGWVKQHRTDLGRLHGRLDAILDGTTPATEQAVEHSDADVDPNDPISAAQAKQTARMSGKPLTAVAGGKQ